MDDNLLEKLLTSRFLVQISFDEMSVKEILSICDLDKVRRRTRGDEREAEE